MPQQQVAFLFITTCFFIGFINFTVVESLQNPYCSLSCDYGGPPVLHTVCERGKEKCGPGPKCGPGFKQIKMTNSLRYFFLDLHNELRNKVAIGNETRTSQPPASNMNVLNYDKELEFIAQCWANACNGQPLDHDHCRSTREYEYVGQNLAFFNSSTNELNLKKVLRQLVMYWYDEVELFSAEWVKETQDRGPNYKVGHYTQMVWADTTAMGCAISYYTLPRGNNEFWHHYLLVCNYSPAGNFIGSPLYQQGKPCSQCEEGKSASSRYKGLCGKVKPIAKTTFSPYFEY